MDFIEANINNKGIPIITGNLNIHMNNSEGVDTNTFLDILDSLDFTNWIQFPTHKSQNTIDLVISPRLSSIITSVSQGHLFSDHYLVNFQIQYTTTKPVTKMINFRKLNSINPQAFSRDVKTLLDDHNLVDQVNAQNFTEIHSLQFLILMLQRRLGRLPPEVESHGSKCLHCHGH